LTDIGPRPGVREALAKMKTAAPPAQIPVEGTGSAPLPPVPSVVPEREFTVEARTQSRMVMRRFFRHKLAMVSLIILLAVVFFAFVGPYLWPWGFQERTGNLSQPPSWDHPFGTDSLGYDMVARVMRGAQKSLLIAFTVALATTALGVIVGATAGYYRGRADAFIMRGVDLMITIPVIVIAATLGRSISGGGWWLLSVILAVLLWTTLARVVRGEFLSLREKEFVEAARAVGASDGRIIFKHILLNSVGSIIVAATLLVADAILIETALSYLGLGVKSPDTSLGLIVSEYQSAFATRPWLFWFPGLMILIIALTVNFVGDGLRDAFDPKQTRVRA
jgi:peptide/nickel transport system permease protein